jgi:hypothetical protein
MHSWLEDARNRIARESGADPAGLALSPEDANRLLELARVAAHESGERTNAPLVCYLVGLVHGRQGGVLEDLVDAAEGGRPE